jgi:uncharacterized protein (DUF1501 family)
MFDLNDLRESRRDFLVRSLQLALTGATVQSLLPGWALAAGRKERQDQGTGATLVVIYMRGGCDALHMVIPFRDPHYYEHRPTIGILPKDQGRERGVIEIHKYFGLHPGLEPLYPLWERKVFAPIINVGSPHPSRSHFDCMDFMEYAAPGDRTVRQGWLNRFLALSAEGRTPSGKELRSVAAQALLPRSLRGDYPVLAVPPLRRDAGGQDPLDIFDEVYGADPEASADGAMEEMEERDESSSPQDPVIMAGRSTIDAIRRFRELVARPADDEGRVRYPGHPLGERLRQIARVIKAGAGLEVAAVDYPGWDHHAREGGADGRMYQMLQVLAEGIAAFTEDLGEERMQKVLVLTMSEFGRTVKENGNGGTDHGHGGIMLAAGGMVQGGQVYGGYSSLDTKQLYEERDLQVHTDFRAVFDEVLRSVFAFNPPNGFFPDYRPGVKDRVKFLSELKRG